jgi:MFS family permease
MKKETIVVVAAVMVLGVMAAVIHLRGVYGFNYNIYSYFSELYFKGVDPYHPPVVPERDINDSFRRPTYLDYTGLQLAVYNLCYLVRHRIWERLDGYVLYSLALWLLTVLGAYELRRRACITPTQFFVFIGMLFAPYLWYVLFFRFYEDKAIYLLLPVAILLLHDWSPRWAAGMLGVLTGLAGVPALVLPVLLLCFVHKTGSLRQSFHGMMKIVIFFGIGFVLSMVPFFPDSILGWVRRSALESGPPMWFSGWHILGNSYFSGLNNLTILITCCLVYLLYGTRWITLNASVTVLLTLPLFFSITIGSQRIMPAVATMVLAFTTRRWLMTYAVMAYSLLLLFFWLDVSRGTFTDYPVHHTVVKSAVLLIPCALGYGLLLSEAIAKRVSQKKAPGVACSAPQGNGVTLRGR